MNDGGALSIKTCMPRILIACDKFKGSLSSAQVNQALRHGIQTLLPQAQIQSLQVADGGQGLIRACQQHTHFEIQPVTCRDPLGRPVQAELAWDPTNKLCLIESAQAIGIHHLKPSQYDIWQSNSAGLGDLIQAALDLQAAKIMIGLGGSATCDGGLGMLDVLGYVFYDQYNQRLKPVPTSLKQIYSVFQPKHKLPPIEVICDVLNPPIGLHGGVRVYSPQKGADLRDIEELELGMQHYVSVLDPGQTQNLGELVSGGAAGCLGLALHALLGARLLSGSNWILEILGFKKRLDSCDYVITGEGCVDLSSWDGKITGQIVQHSLAAGKTVFMISGQKASLPDEMANVLVFELIEYDPFVADSTERSQAVLRQIGQHIAQSIFKKFDAKV